MLGARTVSATDILSLRLPASQGADPTLRAVLAWVDPSGLLPCSGQMSGDWMDLSSALIHSPALAQKAWGEGSVRESFFVPDSLVLALGV